MIALSRSLPPMALVLVLLSGCGLSGRVVWGAHHGGSQVTLTSGAEQAQAHARECAELDRRAKYTRLGTLASAAISAGLMVYAVATDSQALAYVGAGGSVVTALGAGGEAVLDWQRRHSCDLATMGARPTRQTKAKDAPTSDLFDDDLFGVP